MKFSLVALFLFVSTLSLLAQSKKDNTISVVGVSLTEAQKALGSYDFFIENTDEGNQTCFTAPKAMPKATGWNTANIRFFVHVKDSVAILSAKVDLPGLGNNIQVEYRGVKKGLDKQAFLYLDSFARSFGKKVSYSQQ